MILEKRISVEMAKKTDITRGRFTGPSVNTAVISFMIQAPGVNLVKLFGSNFTHSFSKLDHFIIANLYFTKLRKGPAYKKRE
jgi:hypothetical protein